ncbi:MAG TPA: hypothetical protein VHC23_03095 [Jatrophihabitans sp.]|nr:hypothetical protein [Jatrophihabitans sp.]
MAKDEDPIVGAGGANKPEQRNEGDDPAAALPTPRDEEPQSATGKHRRPDDDEDEQ